MYTNIDGLLNKKDELQLRFSTPHAPDVMVLTEVIPKGQKNSVSLNDLGIDGFQEPFINFELNTDNPGKAVRGLAVYVKNGIANVTHLQVETNVIECICVSIETKNDERFIIVAMYRSPSLNGPASTQEVCVIIEEMCKHESDRTLFVGDFNYPEIDWLEYESSHSSNHHTNLFLETIQENLLFQHVLKQTRFRVGQTPSLLDLVLAREELVDGLEYYAPVGLSDHSVLLFSVKLEASWTENREVVSIVYKKLQ